MTRDVTARTSPTPASSSPKSGRLAESRRAHTIAAECDAIAAGAAALRHRITMGRYAGHEAGAYSGYAMCSLLDTVAGDRTRDDNVAQRLRHDAFGVVRHLERDTP